jgi:hypothetical protein
MKNSLLGRRLRVGGASCQVLGKEQFICTTEKARESIQVHRRVAAIYFTI